MSKMTDAEIVRKAMDHWKYLVEVEPDTRRRNGFLKRAADLERIAQRLEQLDEEADRRRIVAAANTLPT